MKSLTLRIICALFFSAVVGFGSTGDIVWKAQESKTTSELRGLSAAGSSIVWASGTKGVFSRTTDGGATWHAGTVKGAESLDFRDVQAVDADTAYLLSIGPQSRIYKTTDGGSHWALQYSNDKPGVFFDAFAFWDAQNAIAFSDPVDGRFLIITTGDGGKTWNEVPRENIPPPLEGEAAFAASGTCIAVQGKSNAWIGTGGGRVSRVLRSTDRGRTWAVAQTPVSAGSASAGIFSIVFRDGKNGVAAGGDYKNPDQPGNNIAKTSDGGKTWKLIERPEPAGYKSSIAYVPQTGRAALVAVGLSGSGYSVDDGQTWVSIDATGYNSVVFAAPSAGWVAGAGGRIARIAGAISRSKNSDQR